MLHTMGGRGYKRLLVLTKKKTNLFKQFDCNYRNSDNISAGNEKINLKELACEAGQNEKSTKIFNKFLARRR